MRKIICITVMLLSAIMTFAQGIESTSVLHDVVFERKIDMLNIEGECYDSVLVRFDVGSVFDESVKVDIWDKHGTQLYRHTFRKMNCVRTTKDFDDNVIVVGKPSMFFLMIKKCDDGPKLCVIREREGITKSPLEYLFEYNFKVRPWEQIDQEQSVETLDNEALRLVKSMPKWIPGTQGGHPVRVKYTVPVTFRLQ